MRVLGIETSCDETALAIYDSKEGLIAHKLYSQIPLHVEFGGVVPELASRNHLAKLLPLLKELLEESHISLDSLSAISYTGGPGLVGALLVGACFAKALGYALQIPTMAIHHMEGHLLAALLEDPAPHFPFLALLVSGGHTQLVEVRHLGDYSILGESLDDAAGEAFDKTAKLLGLDYPGGPKLAKLADNGNPNRFHFPRPLTDRPGLDFSFSGLKTYAMTTIKSLNESSKELSDTSSIESSKADIAFAFQEAIVDTLLIKAKRALKQTGLNRLVIAGGVGANSRLRMKFKELEHSKLCTLYYPRLEFCTDNGAMIAFAGFLRFNAMESMDLKSKKNNTESLQTESLQTESLQVEVRARWPMEELKLNTE